jgi:hypothetical protein
MRVLRAVTASALLGVAVLGYRGETRVAGSVPHARTSTSAPSAASARDLKCPPAPRRVGVLVPAPILVTTNCGRFELRPDGALRRLGPRERTDRRMWMTWGDGMGVGTPDGGARGQVVIYKNGHAVWTSKRRFLVMHTPQYLDAAVIGARSVAFSFTGGVTCRTSFTGSTARPCSQEPIGCRFSSGSDGSASV